MLLSLNPKPQDREAKKRSKAAVTGSHFGGFPQTGVQGLGFRAAVGAPHLGV